MKIYTLWLINMNVYCYINRIVCFIDKLQSLVIHIIGKRFFCKLILFVAGVVFSSFISALVCVVLRLRSHLRFFLRAAASFMLKRVNHITVFFFKEGWFVVCCMIILERQNFGSSVELKLCPCLQLPSNIHRTIIIISLLYFVCFVTCSNIVEGFYE